MAAVLTGHTGTFYERFLMARESFQPKDFGIDMTKVSNIFRAVTRPS